MRLFGVGDQATEADEAVRRVVPIRSEKIGLFCARHIASRITSRETSTLLLTSEGKNENYLEQWGEETPLHSRSAQRARVHGPPVCTGLKRAFSSFISHSLSPDHVT